MNVMKTTLTTNEVAGTIFMHPEEINHHLMNMVSRGLVSSDVLKTKRRSGAIDVAATNELTLVDLAKFAIHCGLDAQQINLLIDSWQARHEQEVKRYIQAERKARRQKPRQDVPDPTAYHHKVLRLFFSPSKVRFMKVLRAQQDVDASELGMRTSNGRLLIGTSTPVIRKAARHSQLQHQEFLDALKSIPGTLRAGSKRFAGYPSRAYSVPVQELLAIIDAE